MMSTPLSLSLSLSPTYFSQTLSLLSPLLSQAISLGIVVVWGKEPGNLFVPWATAGKETSTETKLFFFFVRDAFDCVSRATFGPAGRPGCWSLSLSLCLLPMHRGCKGHPCHHHPSHPALPPTPCFSLLYSLCLPQHRDGGSHFRALSASYATLHSGSQPARSRVDMPPVRPARTLDEHEALPVRTYSTLCRLTAKRKLFIVPNVSPNALLVT